jgi:hypothetical protein
MVYNYISKFILWYINIDPGRQGLEDSFPLKHSDFLGLC